MKTISAIEKGNLAAQKVVDDYYGRLFVNAILKASNMIVKANKQRKCKFNYFLLEKQPHTVFFNDEKRNDN